MRAIASFTGMLAICASAVAQPTIVGWEAYFDADGGPGSGQWFPLTAAPSVNVADAVDASSLSTGFHKLFVRFKTTDGLWSAPGISTVFVKADVPAPTLHEVVACEYFVGDIDPGFGAATAIPLDSIAYTVYLQRELDLLSLVLPNGDYFINIRFKSTSGTWSMIERRPFTVCDTYGALAGFDHVRVGPYFSFIDTSQFAATYSWDFGDGATATVSNPAHTYAEPGLYTVTQMVSNACATTSKQVGVLNSALESYAPHVGGDSSYVTIMFYGAFADSVVATLRQGGEEVVAPDSMTHIYDYTRFSATFNLTDRAHGLWDVQIESVGDTTMLVPEGFEITDATYGVEATLILPTTARLGSKRTGLAAFANIGNINVRAGVGTVLSLNGTPLGYSLPQLQDTLHILGLVLANDGNSFSGAGESGSAAFYYKMEGDVRLEVMLDGADETWPSYADPDCPGFTDGADSYCSCVPDLWFANACANHDTCYYTTFGPTQAECDRRLHTEMLQACSALPFPLDIVCRRAAHTYYDGVTVLGAGPFARDRLPQNSHPYPITTGPSGAIAPPVIPCEPGVTCIEIYAFGSYDPNNKVGESGCGPERWTRQRLLPYVINTENIETATAPVAVAVITDTLDGEVFDLESLQLGSITLGDSVYIIPPNRKEYSMDIDMTADLDVVVRMNAQFQPGNGLLKWQFLALDPTSSEVVDDLRGFLPPNVQSPEGQASVAYTVLAKDGLPHGSVLRNQASIVFDNNEPIITNEWLNTLDLLAPTSSVDQLPATSLDSIVVTWHGSDPGAGITGWDVYVAVNGSTNFQPWLTNYTGSSAAYYGTVDSTYHFYAIAVDCVGNREVKAPLTEASSTIELSTGINDVPAEGTVRIFPNPSAQSCMLVGSMPSACQLQVEICNALGQTLERRTMGIQPGTFRLQLDLSKLAEGSYFAKIKCNDQILTERLIRIGD